MQQLDDLLAGAEIILGDDILDQIDAVVAPGTDAGPMGALYTPPAVADPSLRRRPRAERAAA
jgi:aryl-alcohol dehydrogenase (NADP+)